MSYPKFRKKKKKKIFSCRTKAKLIQNNKKSIGLMNLIKFSSP